MALCSPFHSAVGPAQDAPVAPRQDAIRNGLDMTDLRNDTLTNAALPQPVDHGLGPGETIDLAQPHGQRPLLTSTTLSKRPGSNRREFLRRIWNPYCTLGQTPPEHRHFRTHESHDADLHFGEAEPIDEQLIRDSRLVGTADELIERIRALELERDRLQAMIFAVSNETKWWLADEFSRTVLARL
jgi:5,10-methylenetetrahydromethanopterin reductase